MGERTASRFGRHTRLVGATRGVRDKQAAYSLTRFSANQRVTHTLRTTPADLVEVCMEGHQESMRECFGALIGGPVTDRQWEQVQLTTRDGGFGITDQRHVMHCGYLASWVAVWGLLRRTCPLLAPILGDMEHGTTSAHRSVQRSHDYSGVL